jgi:hypothetical protein
MKTAGPAASAGASAASRSVAHRSSRAWFAPATVRRAASAAVAFFVEIADGGGALTSVEANRRLADLAQTIEADRLHLNRGRLFDRLGRRLRVEEVMPS